MRFITLWLIIIIIILNRGSLTFLLTSSAACTAPGCKWSPWKCFEMTCTVARWPCPAGSQQARAPSRRTHDLRLPPGGSVFFLSPVLALGDTARFLSGSCFPGMLGWRTVWASLPGWGLARSWRAVSVLAGTPAAHQSQRHTRVLHGKARIPPEIRGRHVVKKKKKKVICLYLTWISWI